MIGYSDSLEVRTFAGLSTKYTPVVLYLLALPLGKQLQVVASHLHQACYFHPETHNVPRGAPRLAILSTNPGVWIDWGDGMPSSTLRLKLGTA